MILRGGDRLAMRVMEAGGPPPPLDDIPCDGDVDGAARRLADEDAVTAEARVEALVTIAVQRRRLDEVVFWQRAMFKARLIRARRGIAPPPIGRAPGETTC